MSSYLGGWWKTQLFDTNFRINSYRFHAAPSTLLPSTFLFKGFGSAARVLVLTLGAIIRQVRLSDAYILLVENYSNPLLHFGVFRNLCSLAANRP